MESFLTVGGFAATTRKKGGPFMALEREHNRPTTPSVEGLSLLGPARICVYIRFGDDPFDTLMQFLDFTTRQLRIRSQSHSLCLDQVH
jgi:hypothetical protein